MPKPSLTFTRGSNDSKKKLGRRYPWGMKRTNASPGSLSATAMASIDLSNGSSCWTTAPSPGSPKAMVQEVPLTFSISMRSPQFEANQSRLSRLGSKSVSLGRCCNTTSCTRQPATLTTGVSRPTLPDFVTSICWSKRRQLRYVSGECAWLRTVNPAVPARTNWREHGCCIVSQTFKTWDPVKIQGS